MENAAYRYDAFISYSHHDNSAQIADMLFHHMESYKIPYLLQRRCGRKQIRVFVDHNETSIHESVVDAFRTYMLHSNCAIAICSKAYKESKFSMKHEISFAREHNMCIVAVMVDGKEALPEGFIDEHGQSAPSTILIDFTQGSRSQNILRIIATVLGISFNILNRYEIMRRFLTTGSSTVIVRLCTSIFLVWLAMGAFHIHLYASATCTSARHCISWLREGLMQFRQCNETVGSALGHSYTVFTDPDAPCIKQIHCERCGHLQVVTSHQYERSDTADMAICSVCGTKQAE